MKNATNLSLKNKMKATLGRLLPAKSLKTRYPTFTVEKADDGYRLTTAGQFHRYAGGQNQVSSSRLTLVLPHRQLMVDGEPHWPLECLDPEFVDTSAFAEVSSEIAKKAFPELAKPEKERHPLREPHCGVIPGQLHFEDGQPVFRVNPEEPEFVLFYADVRLNGFAGLNSYNMFRADHQPMDLVLIPFFLAAKLIA
ncbi:hypothetical protein IJJ37_03000 [Candidatus Saccharibacteria bacterium]|nr:hypothetical protein [Candidatus Saccharibacteria bacterium]